MCLYDDPFVQYNSNATSPSIQNVGLMGEFKLIPNDDPFDDDSPNFERTSSQARDTLGQICTYATAHAAAQFRIHVFSFLVFPRYARLLMWDRAGVVVTEKIDFKKDALVLAEFFWRYQYMSAAQRGSDETIWEISPSQRADILQAVPDALALLGANDDSRLCSIPFSGDRTFVISVPLYMGTGSPTGRSTRTFKALCMWTRKIVFLKDTWRVMSPGLLAEHEIYGKLAEARVPHVATLEAFTDVHGQATRTDKFQQETWVKSSGPRRLRKFQHYRLVLKEFARPIQLFQDVKELVQAFRDALEGKRPPFSFWS